MVITNRTNGLTYDILLLKWKRSVRNSNLVNVHLCDYDNCRRKMRRISKPLSVRYNQSKILSSVVALCINLQVICDKCAISVADLQI